LHDADRDDQLSVQYIDNNGDVHDLNWHAGGAAEIQVKGIGRFSIDELGKWEFSFNRSGPEREAMSKEIADKGSHTESVTIIVSDSSGATRSEELSVHIYGDKDHLRVLGSSQSVLTEDKISEATGALDFLIDNVKVAHGTSWIVKSGSHAQFGDLAIDDAGQWHYTLDNNNSAVQHLAEGERLEDNVIVTVTDADGNSVEQTVGIVIIGSNDIPTVAHHQSLTTPEDNLLTITKAQLIENVQDVDTTDSLQVSNLQLVGGGTVVQEGDHWVVHPNLNFDGNLRLEYQVSDGHISVPNALHIDVTASADTPNMIFTKHVGDLSSPLDSFDIQGNENTDLALNINVSSPDSDETLTVEISGLPAGASLSAGTEHNGVWTLQQNELTNLKVTPDADYHGHVDLSVTAISHDGTDVALVSQNIGVDVMPTISMADPAFNPVTSPTPSLSDMSDSPQADVTPVDYSLDMVGLSKDDAALQDTTSGNHDDLGTVVGGDMSDNAAPLVDDMTPDRFENPLDDEHKSHDEQKGHELIDNPLDTDQLGSTSPDDDSLHQISPAVTGAAAYLDALGINPAAPTADAPEHQLPADMDIVMAEADHIALSHGDVSHLDLSDALEHQGHEHDINQQDHDDTQHHQMVDLPDIDPNS
jgi:VCBS repeat-containing protein